MGRPLAVRPPTAQQLRRVRRCRGGPLRPRQRRRAEALLPLAAGHGAAFIAGLLDVHVNAVHADSQALARSGLRCLRATRRRGAPPRSTPAQLEAIWRLAGRSPLALGSPFARRSPAKLRACLVRERPVKAISREHPRRALKNGGPTGAACAASSRAPTPSGGRSCAASRGRGGAAQAAACWPPSTPNRSRSRPTAGGATPARDG